MRRATLVLKNGATLHGVLVALDAHQSAISLAVNDDVLFIPFDDIESALTEPHMTHHPRADCKACEGVCQGIGVTNLLERAEELRKGFYDRR
jgi:hypothetical protein